MSETERTCPFFLRTSGTSNRSWPGTAMTFFFPEKIAFASIRHLAWPCFPVLEMSLDLTV